MTTYKDSQRKVSNPKRSIKVDCVSCENGVLVDENGPIAPEIEKILPEGVTEFTIKISIELPSEVDE